VSGIGVVRVQPHGRLELDARVVRPSLRQQSQPQPVVSRGRLRVEPDGRRTLRDRFVQTAEMLDRHTQVVVRFEKVGIQPSRLSKVRDRFTNRCVDEAHTQKVVHQP
jgi:hypothetical protein